MYVYTIDGADPFLPTLAERLLDGTLWEGGRPADPLALAEATVFLPTRRAARALGDALLAASGKSATVLPRIEALGEGEAEDGAEAGVFGDAAARAAIAAMIPPYLAAVGRADEPDARVLSRASAAELVRLAGDLLALMDQVETQEADWSRLPDLVADTDLAEHWRITTNFLEVATRAWPDFLAAHGRVSAATRRRETAEAAAARVADAAGPMIVAGSTGSIPATRRLIAAIGASRWGRIVLPAFDRSAREADWEAIRTEPDGPAHPQYGMIQLIDALGVAPSEVARLTPARVPAAGEGRSRIVAAASRPAARTGGWLADRAALGDIAAALNGVTLVEAPDERHEAAALAIALRESVELGERAALITPDRGLARRVKHRLARWGLTVDDSAGEPLGATPAGQLVRLVAALAAGGSAADWLGLAKHPVLHRRVDAGAVEAVFRGRRVPGYRVLGVLREAGGGAAAFASAVGDAMAPLLAFGGGRHGVDALAAATAAAFDALVAGEEPPHGASMVREVLAELGEAGGLSLAVRDWPAALDALADGRVQRGPAPGGAVAILGPLEARLIDVDHAVLGGLNEGTWPAAPDAGPWMSRGMMAAFGIDLPERRLGLAAHDVTTALMRPRVTLGRALLAGGEPTVASRWWQRLTAFAGPAADAATERGRRLLDFVAALDGAPAATPAPQPEPRPPVSARPHTLRITDVGVLVRDPYAFYARRILRLEPLELLDAAPDAGDRGSLVHEVMRRFAADPRSRAIDADIAYREAVVAALAALHDAPDARALWGARLLALAPHVVAWEEGRPPHPLVEVKGESDIAGGGRLKGRIDRLDMWPDGSVEVIDFKTGKPATADQVNTLLEPQLPLEAALVVAGAVEGVPAGLRIAALTYVQLAQPREPLKEMRHVAGDEAGVLADRAMENLAALMRAYSLPAKGYLSRARVAFSTKMDGDYDHLARVAEWQK